MPTDSQRRLPDISACPSWKRLTSHRWFPCPLIVNIPGCLNAMATENYINIRSQYFCSTNSRRTDTDFEQLADATAGSGSMPDGGVIALPKQAGCDATYISGGWFISRTWTTEVTSSLVSTLRNTGSHSKRQYCRPCAAFYFVTLPRRKLWI